MSLEGGDWTWGDIARAETGGDFDPDDYPVFDDEPTNDADDVRDAVRAGLVRHEDVYCKHGTFIGTAWGPDYLCGYCEDGVDEHGNPE